MFLVHQNLQFILIQSWILVDGGCLFQDFNLKPTLNDRYERYQTKAAESQAQASAASERVRRAREAQAREEAERRASQHVSRNRSPSASTSTALHDLAHQGKRQLNQLMTFLDKGGNVRDGGRSDNALRQVREARG